MKRRILKVLFLLTFSSVVLQLPKTALAGGPLLLPVAVGLDALLFGFFGCNGTPTEQTEEQ